MDGAVSASTGADVDHGVALMRRAAGCILVVVAAFMSGLAGKGVHKVAVWSGTLRKHHQAGLFTSFAEFVRTIAEFEPS
jgi:hypothetical protein